MLVGLLTLLAATNTPAAVSNVVQEATGMAVSIPDPNDPVEREYRRLLEMDDLAQAEVDDLIVRHARAKGAGDDISGITLRARIKDRLEPVRQGYEGFLQRHPDHARARVAYGSFLSDLGEEQAGAEQWEKARQIDPGIPAVWNNLANYYGHNGPVTNAFVYYAKAIELNPREAIYYQNFGTTVYLFRRDATNFYGITEPEVFEKAMALYRKAMELQPEDFHLATDYARSYYGMKPPKSGTPEGDRAAEKAFYEEALAAWRRAEKLARDDLEREGIQLHFARLQLNTGSFAEARASLDAVTNALFAATKRNLERKLARLTGQDQATNLPAVSVDSSPLSR